VENTIPIAKQVEMLQELIDNLCNPLPVQLRAKLMHIWQEDSLATNNREDLRRIESSSQSNTSQYSELRALASTRRGNLRLNSLDHQEPEGRSLLLDSSALSLQEPYESYQLGRYNNKQILVEWVHMMEHEDIPEFKRRRIQLLAEMLHRSPKPIDFRVLDCVRFVQPNVHPSYSIVMLTQLQVRKPDLSGIRQSLSDILQQPNKYKVLVAYRQLATQEY
jgi:hypothetical protein